MKGALYIEVLLWSRYISGNCVSFELSKNFFFPYFTFEFFYRNNIKEMHVIILETVVVNSKNLSISWLQVEMESRIVT